MQPALPDSAAAGPAARGASAGVGALGKLSVNLGGEGARPQQGEGRGRPHSGL